MAPDTRSTKNTVKEVLMDEEVLSTIKNAICQALDSKFQQLIDRLDKQDGVILDMQCKVERLETGLQNLQKKHQNQEEKVKKLESTLNDQEQYSRRNCVRIFGVPEKERENTSKIVCEIANSHLDVSLKMEDIDRSHRVGRRPEPHAGPVSTSGQKPRAIIVKLTSYQHRLNLLKNRRKLKEKKLGISIFEDLTNANRTLLWEAIQESNKPTSKIQSAWSMDGRIIVTVRTSNNRTMKRQIHSREDLFNIK